MESLRFIFIKEESAILLPLSPALLHCFLLPKYSNFVLVSEWLLLLLWWEKVLWLMRPFCAPVESILGRVLTSVEEIVNNQYQSLRLMTHVRGTRPSHTKQNNVLTEPVIVSFSNGKYVNHYLASVVISIPIWQNEKLQTS